MSQGSSLFLVFEGVRGGLVILCDFRVSWGLSLYPRLLFFIFFL